MTVYKCSTQKDLDQFKNLLVKNVPCTSSLLGWYIGTGYYESDHKGINNIYYSHPDPFNTEDPVVWIVDSGHRIRLYVTSENVLDFAKLTKEGYDYAHTANYKAVAPSAYFTNSQFEQLYEKSLQILETFAVSYFANRNPGDEVLFHAMSLLWSPVMHKLFDIKLNGPSFKYIKRADEVDLDIPFDLSNEYQMTYLHPDNPNDIELVITKNKISYDRDYVVDCFRISTAIRKKDTDELVAWAFAHRDSYIGAVHILPDYRRRGLGEYIINDYCKKYAAFCQKAIPGFQLPQIYFGAAVETFNTPSANMFAKNGWKTLGMGCTWLTFIKKEEGKSKKINALNLASL